MMADKPLEKSFILTESLFNKINLFTQFILNYYEIKCIDTVYLGNDMALCNNPFYVIDFFAIGDTNGSLIQSLKGKTLTDKDIKFDSIRFAREQRFLKNKGYDKLVYPHFITTMVVYSHIGCPDVIVKNSLSKFTFGNMNQIYRELKIIIRKEFLEQKEKSLAKERCPSTAKPNKK